MNKQSTGVPTAGVGVPGASTAMLSPPVALAASGDTDKLIPIRQLAKIVGIRTHVSALHRWATQGVLARDGARVRLRTTRVGGRTYTTLGEFEAFVARQNAEGNGEAATTGSPSLNRRRERELAAVEAELDALGV